jgi:DNA topoisomerase-1
MEYKLGRAGIFMSCTRYPDCEGARQEDGQVLAGDEPLGMHPETGFPIYVRTGRYGPYVEMPLEDEATVAAREAAEEEAAKRGKKKTTKKKKAKIAAKRASIPAGTDPASISLEDAVRFLSLPRELGTHPDTGEPVVANTGRFGPYVAHNGEFRSIKKLDPYTITFDEALAVLAEPKKPPRGVEIVRDIGAHPKTGKMLTLYKSKHGFFLKKGMRRIYLPESEDVDALTPELAVAYLQ